jgi:hypothetical protein
VISSSDDGVARSKELMSMRDRMMEKVSSLRTAIDVIELEIGGE